MNVFDGNKAVSETENSSKQLNSATGKKRNFEENHSGPRAQVGNFRNANQNQGKPIALMHEVRQQGDGAFTQPSLSRPVHQ